MANDYERILTQTEIDTLFLLDKETLAQMLNEIIEALGYNPCSFGTGELVMQIEYREYSKLM